MKDPEIIDVLLNRDSIHSEILLTNSEYLTSGLYAPSNLRILSFGDGALTLGWDNIGYPHSFYRVYAKDVLRDSIARTFDTIETTLFIDSLFYAVLYEFWVVAVVLDTESNPSNVVEHVTTLPPPINPLITYREPDAYGSVSPYQIGNVVSHYSWYLNGIHISDTSTPFYTFSDLPAGVYTMTVTATLLTSGVSSGHSRPVTVEVI